MRTVVWIALLIGYSLRASAFDEPADPGPDAPGTMPAEPETPAAPEPFEPPGAPVQPVPAVPPEAAAPPVAPAPVAPPVPPARSAGVRAPRIGEDSGPRSGPSQKETAPVRAEIAIVGTVDAVGGGRMVVRPFDPARESVRVELPARLPVLAGAIHSDPGALREGMPLRLWVKFSGDPKESPAPIAAELLAPAEVSRLRRVFEVRPAAAIAAARQERIARAAGSQPGRVTDVRDGYVWVRPYRVGAADARLRMDPDTPVFTVDSSRSSAALGPGEDVRVFFAAPRSDGDPPAAIAIDLLSPEESARLRREEQSPPGSMKDEG